MAMAGASLTYWLWWAGSVGVGIALLLTGLWALYAGRLHGRLCPRCRYDLANIAGLRCPECGYQAKRTGKLRGRPRHPWIALFCFLLLNTGALLLVWRQSQTSWSGMLPDRVLIMLLPIAGGPDGAVWNEVHLRVLTKEFSVSEQRMLIERCVRGDYSMRPPEPAWRARYGKLLRVWRDTGPPDELVSLLYDVPVALELVTRPLWPEETEICVQARVEDWWPKRTEIRLTAQPDVADVEPMTFIRTGHYAPPSRFAMFVPPPGKGEHAIEYTVAVEHRGVDEKEDWESAGVMRRTVTVRVERGINDVLPAAEDAVLDEMIADLFSIGIARWESGVSPVRVYFEPERTFVPAFEGVAVGASVRILHDGKVVRSMNLWWLGGPQNVSPDEWSLGWEVPWEDVKTLTTAPGDDDLWSVQVVGLQDVALRVIGAKKYWSGEVTVPTTVMEREGEAPPVPWRLVGND
jgi:hypothetical protein